MIVRWKANRAISKVARRLIENGGPDLDKAAGRLSRQVSRAKDARERLRVLTQDWQLLPHPEDQVNLDRERVMFLKGVLATLSSNRQLTNYDEIRRLCRLSDEQVGAYLDAARADRKESEPDFCSIVVKTAGKPGLGWGNAEEWAAEVQRAHRFWADRRRMDNSEFETCHGVLPSVPGLPNQR